MLTGCGVDSASVKWLKCEIYHSSPAPIKVKYVRVSTSMIILFLHAFVLWHKDDFTFILYLMNSFVDM
jgi:hypothetical protein